MKITLTAILLSLLAVVSVHAAEGAKDTDAKARKIIELKCTRCHTDAQITAAFTAGKDMNRIVTDMERRGASLTSNEKEVLGIFWKQEKKKSK